MAILGVDISEMGQEGISIQRLKDEGAQFCIIRCGGYGDYQDHAFEGFYHQCKEAGMPCGAYWYASATTVDEARHEAESCKRILAGKRLEYPVWYDVEEQAHIQMCTHQPGLLGDVIAAWCSSMEDAGWWAGVYSWKWLIRPCGSKLDRFDHWVCDYTGTSPDEVAHGIWQFGGSVNPFRSPWMAGYVVDQNYAYRDYPELMRQHGTNGFDKEDEMTEADFNRIRGIIREEVGSAVWGYRNADIETEDAYQILRDVRTAAGIKNGQKPHDTADKHSIKYEDAAISRIEKKLG